MKGFLPSFDFIYFLCLRTRKATASNPAIAKIASKPGCPLVVVTGGTVVVPTVVSTTATVVNAGVVTFEVTAGVVATGVPALGVPPGVPSPPSIWYSTIG